MDKGVFPKILARKSEDGRGEPALPGTSFLSFFETGFFLYSSGCPEVTL